jgi:hypothetical protein
MQAASPTEVPPNFITCNLVFICSQNRRRNDTVSRPWGDQIFAFMCYSEDSESHRFGRMAGGLTLPPQNSENPVGLGWKSKK